MNDYFNEDFLTDEEVKKSKKKVLIGTLVSLCILISLIIFAIYVNMCYILIEVNIYE